MMNQPTEYVTLKDAAERTGLSADDIAALLNSDTTAWVLDSDGYVLGITPDAIAWIMSGEATGFGTS